MFKVVDVDDSTSSKEYYFLYASERTGYSHLYLNKFFNEKCFLMRAVSSGEWIVESLVGVDIRQDLVYVTETYDSPLERHLYPLPLLKKRRKRGKVVLC